MQRISNRHIPINQINTKSSYQSTMARFNSILNNKLGVNSRMPMTSLDPRAVKTAQVDAQLTENQQIQSVDSNVDKLSNIALISPTDRSLIALNPADNVTLSSGNSVAKINDALANSPIQGLGQAFKNAEQKSGVNAYVLASMAIHESNYGKSSIAQNKHNIFGFMAYDDNPYANAKSYASFEESIYDVADYLSENYLKEEGKYYRGTSLADIGKNYASDPMWAEKVTEHVERLLK